MTHPKKKKKAKKIDRKRNTIKLWKWRIPLDNLCIGLLVLILVVSSFAVFVGRDREQDVPVGQANVVFSMENNLLHSEIINLTEEMTALEAFQEAGEVGLGHTDTGVYVKHVTYNRSVITGNETHGWFFYANGILKLTPINRYQVQHGDTIQLRFEEKPF